MKKAVVILAIAVLALAIFGLVVNLSISTVEGQRLQNDSFHYIKNQSTFFVIALIVSIAIIFIPLDKLFSRGMIYLYIAAIIIGLVIVHIPGLGKDVKGSSRWINLMGINIQTSEFIKLAAIILMAWWHGCKWRKNGTLVEGILIPCCGIGLISIGLLLQPDFGSTIMLAAICVAIMLTAGVNYKILFGLGTLAIAGISTLIALDPVRLKRVLPIIQLNISDNVSAEILSDDLYQVQAAISAFKYGGVTGKGFGNSIFKEHYLPEYHTDFVLSMIGEELGIIGTSIVIILILVIFCCGLYISYKTENAQHRLLALGMTLQISLYGFVNTAVVCGLFPTKGLAMPFLSYGGSNLVCSFIAASLIVSVGKEYIDYEDSESLPQHNTNFWKM